MAGLEAPRIENATGFVDTNFAGKIDAAKHILTENDFVFVHIEAPDECGHKGDLNLKTHAIELFDKEIVAPMHQFLEESGEPYTLIICTDHRTPVKLRGHTSEPVPMAWVQGPTGPIYDRASFDEFTGQDEDIPFAFDVISRLLKNLG